MEFSPIYVPRPGLHTYMDDFRHFTAAQMTVNLSSYHDLHKFSVERPNEFWTLLWKFLDIKASSQPSKAIDEALRIDQFPPFFAGAKLNYAENILRTRGNGIALKCIDESSLRKPESITWDDLRAQVREAADAMHFSGVRRHDVFVAIGGNSAKSVALLLATASLGAVFASFSTELGEMALLDRLTQLKPKLVFAQTEYSYNGKKHRITGKITKVFATAPKAPGAELISYFDSVESPGYTDDCGVPLVPWSEFVGRTSGRKLSFEQVAFHHPLVILFSSGTTGTPKGIVHSHGGLVVNGMKENRLHNNFGPSDVYFHFTNIGWTLWNISLGALLCGSTLVLYDGSPFYPSPSVFLQSALSTGITAFGAGPRYFEEIRIANIKPNSFPHIVDLILSTGAILTASLSLWISHAFGPVCQISMSGGTEFCGSFVHGTKTLPTWPGQITVKALGLDVDVFSLNGQSVPPGEMGELVCKTPFPNMPTSFLNDHKKKRYFDAYFYSIPHVWTHGDLIKVDPKTKGLIILGRSDGVLNPSGVRFGSSEIYSVLAKRFAKQVLDALCVGQQRQDKDMSERVFLFVKPYPPLRSQVGRLLETSIRRAIAQDLSRRHVPQFVFELETIPYNANGKKMEIKAKAILNRGLHGLNSLKISREERAMLEPLLKFFNIEDLLTKIVAKI